MYGVWASNSAENVAEFTLRLPFYAAICDYRVTWLDIHKSIGWLICENETILCDVIETPGIFVSRRKTMSVVVLDKEDLYK